MLDIDGQPTNRFYNRKRINDRAIDELIGISKGVIADGRITQSEAEFLQSWMEVNVPYTEDPIVNQLYARVQGMLIDGILDIEEQQELFSMLCMFTGQATPTDVYVNLTCSLPVNKPAPKVEFPTMSFCFTGKFAYGPRKMCQEVVEERGGKISKSITKKLDYLVVGFFGSTDWIHSPYGRKIEKAADYRELYGNLAIISEDHWATHAFRM